MPSLFKKIRRGFDRLLGRETRGFPGATGFWIPGTVLSGIVVTPQTALNFTSVFAAINVIATDIASMPLRVMKYLPNGGKVEDRDFYLYDIVRNSPNPIMNANRYRKAMMGHVLGWGNSYSVIRRNEWDGSVKRLEFLTPGHTEAKQDAQGRIYYESRDDQGGGVQAYVVDNVLHMAGLGYDGLTGYSPLTLARQAVGLGIAAEEFGAAFFGNGAVPKGALKASGQLSSAARQNLRESFGAIHQGVANSNKLMILEEGLDWVNTQVAPDDAQFLATREFQRVEIAAIFSLPPHKIGDYSNAHITGVEEANENYLMTTLLGWVEALEAEYNAKLLTSDERKTHVIEHDMDNYKRGNMAARADYYTKMRLSGVVSGDEVRSKEGFNPVGVDAGGSKIIVPLNYTTLEKIGETEAPEPNPNPEIKSKLEDIHGFTKDQTQNPI